MNPNLKLNRRARVAALVIFLYWLQPAYLAVAAPSCAMSFASQTAALIQQISSSSFTGLAVEPEVHFELKAGKEVDIAIYDGARTLEMKDNNVYQKIRKFEEYNYEVSKTRIKRLVQSATPESWPEDINGFLTSNEPNVTKIRGEFERSIYVDIKSRDEFGYERRIAGYIFLLSRAPREELSYHEVARVQHADLFNIEPLISGAKVLSVQNATPPSALTKSEWQVEIKRYSGRAGRLKREGLSVFEFLKIGLIYIQTKLPQTKRFWFYTDVSRLRLYQRLVRQMGLPPIEIYKTLQVLTADGKKVDEAVGYFDNSTIAKGLAIIRATSQNSGVINP